MSRIDGADVFVFNSTSDGKTRPPTSLTASTRWNSRPGFGLSAGTDPFDVFGVSAGAAFGSAEERFQYDTTADTLYFDPDGTNTGFEAVAIAQFLNDITLRADNITII